MNNKNKKLLILLVIFLFFPLITLAGTTGLGHVCTQDADCVSTKCAQSTLTGAQSKFCVCINETQCEAVFKKEGNETWTCKPGEDKTKGLPYCLSSTKGIKDPIAFLSGVVADGPLSGTTTNNTTEATDKVELTVPKPEVKIPGLPDWTPKKVAPGETTQITYIADYIVAIYKYGLIIGSILAVMMIMIGGIIYLTAAGAEGLITTGKNLIYGAVSGIILLLGSYLLLMTINPNILTLSPINIETITGTYEEAVIMVYGSSDPGADNMPTITGVPGKWRTMMTDASICGNKDSLNLSLEQRYQKLKQIVAAWKSIGLDQGGAIYLRGGSWDCSWAGVNEAPWLFWSLYGAVLDKKTSSYTPSFASSKCGQILITDIKSILDKAPGKNYQDKISALKEDKSFNALISPCKDAYKEEYFKLIKAPSQKNGMLCGDCGTFQVSLYHRCFDSRIESNDVKNSPKSGHRFTVSLAEMKSTPNKYVGQMKFGDIIRMTGMGHYVMYTGGMGLPFEIMEMGGGGSNDQVMKGGKLANQNAGTGYDVSAMRAHPNAVKFFEKTPGKSGELIITGVIDNPKFNQYIQ